MAPTAAQVLAAVKRSGAKYELCDGWDDPKIAATGTWDPQYVIQHHTANGGAHGASPSLGWVIHDNYFPIRGCHFLIGRDGIVHVVYALKCYHAGAGGPGSWGGGPTVPKDTMNGHAYGIEIESKGTSLVVSDVDGITAAQYDALARLNAVLLDLIGAADVGRIINHRTWAPGRKSDTRDTDAHLQAITREMRARLNAQPVHPVVVAMPLAEFHGTRSPGSSGPAIATARAALGLPPGRTWDPAFTTAWTAYLRTHLRIRIQGNRVNLMNARGYASLLKQLD